ARSRAPVALTVRAVFGIRAESQTPNDASKGLVWSAIVDQIDRPGSQSDFVSAADVQGERFHSHPWSIGGGGAAELKVAIEGACATTLVDSIEEIGRTTHTGEDDAYYLAISAAKTHHLAAFCVPLVVGEEVRDYATTSALWSVFPYDRESADRLDPLPQTLARHFWSLRTTLRNRKDYGHTPEERGLRWFDHSMFFPGRYRT